MKPLPWQLVCKSQRPLVQTLKHSCPQRNGSDFPPDRTRRSTSCTSPGALPKGYCVTRSITKPWPAEARCRLQARRALPASAARRPSALRSLHAKYPSPKPRGIPARGRPKGCKLSPRSGLLLRKLTLRLGRIEKLAQCFPQGLPGLDAVAKLN